MGDFAGDFHEDTADDGTAPRPVEYRITATAAPFSQEDWGIKIVCHLGASANPEQRNEFQSSPKSFGRHTSEARSGGPPFVRFVLICLLCRQRSMPCRICITQKTRRRNQRRSRAQVQRIVACWKPEVGSALTTFHLMSYFITAQT